MLACMNFCSECGASVALKTPTGDNLPRYVCVQCNAIHYQNPKVVAGCIVEWHKKILLCRRAIEPQHGRWTLPAGFMENGESTIEAALRETREEACAQAENLRLYCMYSLPHIDQIYILFRGDSVDGNAAAGAESLEVAFVDAEHIPWDELAFPVIEETLRRFLDDREIEHLPARLGDIVRQKDRSYSITRY